MADRVYDKPITVQVIDADTETWTDWLHLHARINRTGGSESEGGGAGQYHPVLSFELRYVAQLAAIRLAPQYYRIVYRDQTYNIRDYDDYMEQHRTVKIGGAAYV